MNYSESIQYLRRLGSELHTAKFSLRNIERMCHALGHPERCFPSVLIAGTNGKGSTAAFLYSILLRAGIPAGCYTSPHLSCLRERIRCGRDCISETDFADSLSEVHARVAALLAKRRWMSAPTYFEVLTATAFYYFAQKKVSPVVLEVGLGGRLDATNISCPVATAITGIALDHTQFLGGTLLSIAREKTGILREKVPLVLGDMDSRTHRWILRRAHQIGSPVKDWDDGMVTTASSCRGGDSGIEGDVVSHRYGHLHPSLPGRHQASNSAVAVQLAEILADRGWPIHGSHIRDGVAHAFWPGRMQFLKGSPEILLDGAHNMQGIVQLVSFLRRQDSGRSRCLIFAAMRDKEVSSMLRTLCPVFPKVILTRAQNPRSASVGELLTMTPKSFLSRVTTADDLPQAIRTAREYGNGDHLVVVAGSLFLVGEALRELRFDTTQPL